MLIATPVAHPGQIIRTIEGNLIQGQAGDWTISTTSGAVVRVIGQSVLDEAYETVEEGGISLSGRMTRQLEDRLGPGTCASGERLVAAVTRLAKIGVGEVELNFTPGQLEEMARRAERNRRTVAQEVQIVLQRLEDELFHGGQARSAVGRV